MVDGGSSLVDGVENASLVRPKTRRGVQKIEREEPKSCWCQFKLGSFDVLKEVYGVKAHLNLMLKTRPRFCPASSSLSIDKFKMKHSNCMEALCHAYMHCLPS